MSVGRPMWLFQFIAGTDVSCPGSIWGRIMAHIHYFRPSLSNTNRYFFGIIPMPMMLLLVLYIAHDAYGLLGGNRQNRSLSRPTLGGAAFGFVYFKAQWRLVNLWPSNWSLNVARPGPKTASLFAASRTESRRNATRRRSERSPRPVFRFEFGSRAGTPFWKRSARQGKKQPDGARSSRSLMRGERNLPATGGNDLFVQRRAGGEAKAFASGSPAKRAPPNSRLKPPYRHRPIQPGYSAHGGVGMDRPISRRRGC